MWIGGMMRRMGGNGGDNGRGWWGCQWEGMSMWVGGEDDPRTETAWKKTVAGFEVGRHANWVSEETNERWGSDRWRNPLLTSGCEGALDRDDRPMMWTDEVSRCVGSSPAAAVRETTYALPLWRKKYDAEDDKGKTGVRMAEKKRWEQVNGAWDSLCIGARKKKYGAAEDERWKQV